MEVQKNRTLYSKKSKRELSGFFAKEMLYDYASGRLDGERRKALEKSLKSSKDLKEELRTLQNGLDYCQLLRKTEISDQLSENLREPVGFFQKFAQKFSMSRWPSPLKWGVEAAVLGLFVAMVIQMTPWEQYFIKFYKKSQDHLVLSEISHKKFSQNVAINEKPLPQLEKKAVVTQKQEPKPVKEPVENTAPAKVAQIEKKAVAAPVTPKPATQGFVYRVIMNSHEVDKLTIQIVEKIRSLGGSKAGNVELGLRKKGGSYFHIQMEEEKYDQFILSLKEYGNINIRKDSHSRIMPEGLIRIVLWVEDLSAKKK